MEVWQQANGKRSWFGLESFLTISTASSLGSLFHDSSFWSQFDTIPQHCFSSPLPRDISVISVNLYLDATFSKYRTAQC